MEKEADLSETETENRSALMQRMREAGITDPQIAEVFDLSKQRVNTILGPVGKRARHVAIAHHAMNYRDAQEALPQELWRWRNRHNWTQADAANVLCLGNVNVFSRWERRSVKCSLAALLLQFIKLYDERNPP